MFEGHPFRDAPARKLASTRIKPRVSRRAKLAGMAVVAGFWNSICTVLLIRVLPSGEGLLIAFMSVFVIVGAVMLGFAVHAFLALFNPVVEIHVKQERPALGETMHLSWQLTGKAGRVKRLQIDLEGVEEATCSRGTDTVTERERFAIRPITAATTSRAIARGRAKVMIPRSSVPSFTATNNKIVWRLIVHGEITNWPDIREEFLLDVVAHRRVRRKAAA